MKKQTEESNLKYYNKLTKEKLDEIIDEIFFKPPSKEPEFVFYTKEGKENFDRIIKEEINKRYGPIQLEFDFKEDDTVTLEGIDVTASRIPLDDLAEAPKIRKNLKE